MSKQQVLQTLGLAMRARKVVLGEDFILAAMKTEGPKMVFLASDAGENFRKKIYDKATTYKVKVCIDLTTEELSNAIGKQNRKAVLLKDKGFIKLVIKQLDF